MNKQDPKRIAVGLWDKENNTIQLSKNICQVVTTSVNKLVWENYGSGGWIEGREQVERTVYTHTVYKDGVKIGVIDTYNVMFVSPDRYKVILNKDYRDIFPKVEV
jgi:hypothetical protein